MLSNRGASLVAGAVVLVLGNSACSDDGGRDQLGPIDTVGLELVAEGFASPVLLREPPDGSNRLFVVDQVGLVHIISGDGVREREPFLDLRSRLVKLMDEFDERGLLGLAFHPEFATNGRLYVYYSAPLRDNAPVDYDHTSRISEITMVDDQPELVEPMAERILLEIDQPQFNNNGGTLAFGPEGYLYISLGDGGGANDMGVGHPPLGNGQDIETLLGSILRIDVDGGTPYGIPIDNPFVGDTGRAEIYAYGFHNPYRIAFDQSGELGLLAADVGQNRWEEIDVVTRGGNYGWNLREGTHCFDANNPSALPTQCPDRGPTGEPLIAPVLEYPNVAEPGGLGTAVIGGFVYRGRRIDGLQGQYVFGDFSAAPGTPAGKLFAASGQHGRWSMRELLIEGSPNGELDAFVRGFGQDRKGELYVLVSQETGPTGTSGQVYRLVPAPANDAVD